VFIPGGKVPVQHTLGQTAGAARPEYCIFIQPIARRSTMELQTKLAILADAAKYDASCASSGTTRRDSRDGKGLGSTEGMGICHSFTPDGRCISLLKVLLTNHCQYDCLYCINRSSRMCPARVSGSTRWCS
jgi:hypothetical protein